jgi:hypothetical protein
MTDVRTPLEEGDSHTWPFAVRASGDGEVMLTFENITETVPDDYDLEAVLEGTTYDLRTTPELTFDHPGGDEAVPLEITVTSPLTGVGSEPAQLPTAFALSAYPNPFNERMVVRVELPAASETCVTLHNILGAQVAELHHGPLPAGYHELVLDGHALAAGVYFLAARDSHGHSQTRKVVFLR